MHKVAEARTIFTNMHDKFWVFIEASLSTHKYCTTITSSPNHERRMQEGSRPLEPLKTGHTQGCRVYVSICVRKKRSKQRNGRGGGGAASDNFLPLAERVAM